MEPSHLGMAPIPSIPDSDGAVCIITDLRGDKTQREAAYVHLDGLCESANGTQGALEQQREQALDVAAQCVGPLTESVCSADVSVVDAVEFRRAHLLLGKLCMVDPLRLTSEWVRGSRHSIAWLTPGNVCAAVFDKDLSELTRNDLLTLAGPHAIFAISMSRGKHTPLNEAQSNAVACNLTLFIISWIAGTDATNKAGGIDYTQWLTGAIAARFNATHENTLPDDFVERLCLLALDILREPHDALELERAGLFVVIAQSLAGRAPVATVLIEAGLLETAVSILQLSSPTDWIAWRTVTGIVANGITALGWTLSTLALTNKTQLLLDKGFVDVAISVMKAFEMRGVSKVHEATPLGIWCCVQMLATLDLTAAEAQPIVKVLKTIPSTLHYMLKNNLDHCKGIGQTTLPTCSTLCALAFGKQEAGDGDFVFNQAIIDGIATNCSFWFSGTGTRFMPVLPPFFLRGIVHLCVSDAHKMLVVQCTDMIALLTEALLLDPSHVRQTQEAATKMSIQQDGAECFLQLALCESGCQALMENSAVVEALRCLADGHALSEKTKQYANGAVIALESSSHEHRSQQLHRLQHVGHVMVSYQWDAQRVIERIVRSLQQRKYDVWFDLDMMKGNILTAMSEGVDGAAVVLFGVSLAYKESGNCHLEAQYAHTSQVDMVPLMMQKNYTAKGWLGILLGSRLYYPFFEETEHEDQATFEKRVDALARELGNRGKTGVKTNACISEGVPPSAVTVDASSAPASAPLTAPAVAQAAETPQRPSTAPVDTTTIKDLAQFIIQMRQDAVAERDQLEAKLKAEHKAEMDKLRAEIISPDEMLALQARLERLHSTQMLTDDEFFELENLCCDFHEVKAATIGGSPMQEMLYSRPEGLIVASKLARLIAVSEGLASDAGFARQIRRRLEEWR